MLHLVVERYKKDHPDQVRNEDLRQRHVQIVSAMLVDGLYDIHSRREGTFAQALFSTAFRRFATYEAMALEISQLRQKIANMTFAHETSDAAHKLQLELKNEEIFKLKQELGGMNELRRKKERAEKGEAEAKGVVDRLEKDLKHAVSSRKNIVATAADQVKALKAQIAAAEERAAAHL